MSLSDAAGSEHAAPRALPAFPTKRSNQRSSDVVDRAEWLAERRRSATTGDEIATRKRHDRGRLTARERVHLLLDPGTFTETDLFARHRASGFGLEDHRPETDGVITGWGEVHGRRVAVVAHDARIFGGSLGETFAGKVHKLQDLAESAGIPLVVINDGGGARIQEGVAALAGFGGIFRRNVRASGVIPQISIVAGSCAGGAAYSPALTDFVFMIRDSSTMFVTGPDVVASVTGERVSASDLGGTDLHASSTGVATFVAEDEATCYADVRYLLAFLPSNNVEQPPAYEPTDSPYRPCPELLGVVPADPRRAYDVRRVISSVVDDHEFLELHEGWARNVVCALARVDGHTVGIVANQPAWLEGALDIDAAEKAARFVQTCDAFNIPLVTLVDVPGFLPGTDQEAAGIVRRGAKLLYAYCAATVPRICVVLRKAYGGAYIAMDSKSIGADLVFAWPTNEISVMGPEAAANIVFRRQIAAAAEPELRRAALLTEYTDRLVHPLAAAEQGLVDDVIDPADTRRTLVRSLALLRHKTSQSPQRKHGNGPL